MDATQVGSTQPRTTSGSARPHGSRVTNPDKQISQIEKSVTHLLVATKQLLETLTQWSRGNAQEEEVSDVYVRLGYEFNLACRAFSSIGVDTSDLGPVPDLLRSILEDTLSQPASPQSLDNYLPRIRDIIINLLHGLKRKQSKLRSRSSKDAASKPTSTPARQGSLGSAVSTDTSIGAAIDGLPTPPSTTRLESRQDSVRSNNEQDWVPANTSAAPTIQRNSLQRHSQRSQLRQDSSDTLNSSTPPPLIQSPVESERIAPSNEMPFPHPPPPPPPPKQDALTALQRGGELERRASRRFSAYQISKHLGASTNGIPVIPPAQNSPIPNRGRELKESMNAVRSRTSNASTRQRPVNRALETAVSRSASSRNVPARISEERESSLEILSGVRKTEHPPSPQEIDSPIAKTPDEFEAPRSAVSTNSIGPILGPTVNGPLSPEPKEFLPRFHKTLSSIANAEPVKIDTSATTENESAVRAMTPQQTSPSQQIDIPSPSQSKELILFLQYKSKIKKFVLAEGYDELTVARLQLAFIEKFNWNTHNNGVDLPEIYIQDPVSGVRHELEDLTDVKDRSVLVLNIEVLDEVKKHFDEGIGGLKTTLDGVRSLLDGQGSLMQMFSDRQLQTAKDMARLSAAPPPRAIAIPVATPSSAGPTKLSSMTEVQNLRRDIAVLRQTYATMSSDFAAAMTNIKANAETVKATAVQAVAPSYEGNAGRAHVNQGKKELNSESEMIVNRVDDLSDAVEDLRKDVVTRGVRPLPRQLENISREITATAKDLLKMKEFLKREKPIWTKIWENELNLVCTERDDLTQQEDLMADLDGDLEDVAEVFKLVEEAMKQQSLQGQVTGSLRNASRSLDIDPSVDPQSAKDGVLGEVRALQPNHESRLEAIERAEKARLKELESRKGGEFEREVAQFVEEGKLRKTGGMEEVERLRMIKDERARKENHETQQRLALERERRRGEAAAKKAAAAEESAKVAAVPIETSQTDGTTAEPEPQSIDEPIAETKVEDIAIETPLPDSSMLSESAHDVSGGEASFQDAPESATSSSPIPDQIDDATITPQALHPVHSPKVAEAQDKFAEAHPEPEEFTELKETAPHETHETGNAQTDKRKSTDSIKSSASNKDRSSWWKPAIFSP